MEEEKTKKKKELTLEEKMTIALVNTPIVMPTEKEILQELLKETYKTYRRNKLINNYLTELFLKDKNNSVVVQQMAQIQTENKGTEIFLSWLLNKI